MNKLLCILTLALAATSAYAAAPTASASAAAASASASTPEDVAAANERRSRVAVCNREAGGKNGPGRKAFMDECVNRKPKAK